MIIYHADIKGNDKIYANWLSKKYDELLTNSGYLSTQLSFSFS